VKKNTDTPKNAGLRRRAEQRLGQQEEQFVSPPPGEDAKRMVHELQIHQIELELQNEELKQTRGELERQLEKYSDLYNFAPVGYFTLDESGAILEANLTGGKLLGIDRSGLLGSRFAFWVSHDSRAAFDLWLTNIFKGSTAETCEMALKGDRPRYLQIEGAVAESGEGKIRQCRLAAMDITRRKRAEEELRLSEERHQSYIKVTGELGWATNRDGEVVEDLPTWRAFTGQSAEEIKGSGWANALHPADVESVMHTWNNAVVTKNAYEVEYRVRRHDGVYRHFLARGVPLFDEKGTIREWVGACIDITERKAAEEMLDQANRRLVEAKNEVDLIVEERTIELKRAYENLRVETEDRLRAEGELRQSQKMEAMGTLAGGIAHDFNNILAAIIGFGELARDKTPEGSSLRHHMDRVVAAGIRGRELVERILVFSRRSEQKKQPTKLATIVKDILGLLRASFPATIKIHLHIGDEFGFILVDSIQIQQVVMNLCMNAAYALRQTGGVISMHVDGFNRTPSGAPPNSTMSPGLYARLSVEDTGEGMSPDMLEYIFDPFFTTKPTGEGTGLGLSVVHGIVASHGGAVTVSSEPGKGSIFTIFLPVTMGEQIQDPRDLGNTIPRGHERVLFVDDEDDIAVAADGMLTDIGYHVTRKTSPREALALFRLDPFRFDLIITDQTMPEMTGEELVKEVLALRADIPVIMCTGFSNLVDAEKAAGVQTLLMKPLTKREIALAVRKALDEGGETAPA
jgi:PAS domain S-box-containing protein